MKIMFLNHFLNNDERKKKTHMKQFKFMKVDLHKIIIKNKVKETKIKTKNKKIIGIKQKKKVEGKKRNESTYPIQIQSSS